jgi:hypothetical protein
VPKAGHTTSPGGRAFRLRRRPRDLETRWDRRGWRTGLWVGFLGSMVSFILASRQAGNGTAEIVGGLVCIAPLGSFLCGLLGAVLGLWVAFAVRVFKGRRPEVDRALEAALDGHEELARRWGEVPADEGGLPEDERRGPDQFAPDDRITDGRRPPG